MKSYYIGRKINFGIWPRLAVLALLIFAGGASASSHFPRIWVDDTNGYAIGGYDPVDYFVLADAVRPNTAIEAVWGGVNWKFRNVGNRQAFLAHPETYAPRFGGADPYLLTKHRQVLGNPTLFDVYEGRLYLFYDGLSLLRWKRHRAAYIIHAKAIWPKVAVKLGLAVKVVKPAQKPVVVPVPGPSESPFPEE